MMLPRFFAVCAALVTFVVGLSVDSATKLSSDPFYATWMGELAPVIGNLTILDLSLPGTHDTMTFDMSTTIADEANDIPAWMAHVLHDIAPLINIWQVGEFIHNQSKSQGLTITEQLDSGIRFIDFRMTYTAPPNATSSAAHDWYCLHLAESNHPSLTYYTAIRDWLVTHPKEVVVLWVSKHGSPCHTVWGASNAVQQAYWQTILDIFGPLVLDRATGAAMNTTTINELVSAGTRAVFIVSDYQNFTAGGSSKAYDACSNLDNEFCASVQNATASVEACTTKFQKAEAHIAQDKAKDALYLLSMASQPSQQIMDATIITYFPWLFNVSDEKAKCAKVFNVPGMNEWCPMHLQAMAQLENYYSQISFENAVTNDYGIPNAVYINAVDYNGTIRTGYTLFGQNNYPDGWIPVQGGTNGYSYVATLMLVNLRRGCKNASPTVAATCATLQETIEGLRAQNPLQRWHDPYHGRLANWP